KKMTKSDAPPILAAALMHKDYIAKNPEAAVRVVRAMIEATKFGNTNNAEAAAFLKQASNLKATAAASYAKLWSRIYTASMEPADVAAYKEMAKIFQASGTIKGTVPDSVFNATLYEKAKQLK
ncbi:MAG TPA: ABC transporter substrate-binding protein, partial [Hyphomicrobiaceae bacterium]|nr:ABC transporter substrate-binding protein [Hyphomicrobiaceae bacterium]